MENDKDTMNAVVVAHEEEEREYDYGDKQELEQEQDHPEDSGYDNKQQPQIVSAHHPEKAPYFILHVGPQKSGTTTIQQIVSSNNFEELLLKDNYFFIGSRVGRERGVLDNSKPIYLKNTTPGQNSTLELSSDLRHKVDELGRRQSNIFASSEYLHSLDTEDKKNCWRRLLLSKNQTQQQKWNLQIVVTYRRLHSYLPSLWNQYYKKYRVDKKGRPLHKHLDWPGINGDYAILPFPEWFSEQVLLEGSQLKHLAKQTYDRWLTLADGIGMTVVNLHEEGDFAENFFCRVLKGATNICSKLSSSHKNSSNSRRRLARENASVNLDYDILGVYAYENGLINHKYSRVHISNEIKKYATGLDTGNSTDYFRNCLDKNTRKFLRQSSLEYEEWFIDAEKKNSLKDSENIKPSLSVDQYENFNADWEAALAKNVFCSIDAKKTLTVQHWKAFFTRFE